MAFSQSLDIGNSTLLNLDSQARHAFDIGEKGQQDAHNKLGNKEDAVDVIQESPEHGKRSKQFSNIAGMSMFSRSRTQRQLSRNNCSKTSAQNVDVSEKDRRRLRRSKSDSTLQKPNTLNGTNKAENYTELFRSGFTFSIEGEQQKSAFGESGSVLRVSQIEAVFEMIQEEKLEVAVDVDEMIVEDEHAVNNDLDMPIFSEDLNALLANVKSIQEEKDVSDVAAPSSMSLSQFAIDSTKCEEKITDEIAEVDARQLDQSRFICADAGSLEAKQQLEKELEISRREVTKVDEVLQPKKVRTGANASYAQRSTTSFTTTNVTSVKKTDDIVRDLETLKRISAWNLPHSVLKEYEKKGVIKMFDWQVECLSNPKVIFEHCNLVYSAPTSAGKSLVSEILLLKTVLERNKKVLFILPFISVVREKMFYLQDLLTVAGYRVEGFFGGYTPPGGFDSIHVAICTIEKANSIINKLLEQGKLDDIGTVVVDEVHLISDPGRGYILELLIAKVLYMSRKYGFHLQVVTMSATLANVELLKRWLDAELFITDFRPVALKEMIKIGNKVFDSKLRPLRDITSPLQGEVHPLPPIQNDNDHVAQLCIETLLEGCSVIVFCPSKDWCENLATQLASAIQSLIRKDDYWGKRLRAQIKSDEIEQVKKQLRDIPTGLDTVLERMITFGCAFHHAGLTSEERDIIEASFKACVLKIIVATSTLSSGVNLPARRVLIRTPLFGGKQMSSLTYRQMIGRAGRTGKDTLGESILICTPVNTRIGQELIQADLKPIYSCLEQESSTHLKRALLEVISSGVAITKDDIESFVNCTLLSAEKQLSEQGKDKSTDDEAHFIKDALDFLIEYEFVRLQVDNETNRESYVATRLGQACLAASMPPTDGLILFAELQKSRRCFVLESELHAVYLVTPYSVCYQLQDLDWLLFLDMWEKLTPAMKKVGELVGVKESFLVRAMRGQSKLDYKLMQIHKRFYTALALQELVNEVPINKVAVKYKCTRGMLQSLQQMSSTFAGIVTAFCNSLQWPTLSLVVSQFKERLFFGIHRDLIDLMRLPDLNHKRARALFDAGITTLVDLANADIFEVEKVLYNALSFDSAKQHDNEADYEAEQRNQAREFFITGKVGLTVAEGAKLLVQEARIFVQYEIGVGAIKWTQEGTNEASSIQSLHMSCEEHEKELGVKRKSVEQRSVEEITPPKLKRLENDAKHHEKPSTSKNALRALRQRQLSAKNDKLTVQENFSLNSKEKQGIDVEPKEATTQTNSAAINIKENPVVQTVGAQKRNRSLTAATVAKIINADGNKENKDTNAASKASPTAKKAEVLQRTNKVVDNNKIDEKKAKNAAQNLKNVATDFNLKTTKNEQALKTVNSETKKYALRKSNENQEISKPATKESATFTPNAKRNANTLTPSSLKQAGSTKNDLNSVKQAASTTKSPTSVKQSPQAAQVIRTGTRRSPRNHQRNSNGTKFGTVESKVPPPTSPQPAKNSSKHFDQSLFLADDSFELNTGINAALEAANQSHKALKTSPTTDNKANDDEIAESQQIVPAVIDSPVQAKHSVHASRLLRTTQRLRAAHKSRITKDESNTSTHPSSSIEVSDLSLENSLLQNPLQLNVSHILNCTKVDDASANFKSLEIVDICGDEQLFSAALRELLEVQRFGFCIGLQQQEAKCKPLIGGNLLINQRAGTENAAQQAVAKEYQIDDHTYLAGCAFGITENVVYYMNMQPEGTCASVTTEMKCKFLSSLLTTGKCTLLCVDAKEQLKVLYRVLGELSELRVELEDPKEANWLLQPDKFMTFQQMTQQFAPECTALTGLCGNGRGYSSHGLDTVSAITAKVRCSVEACVTVHILKTQIENLERIGSGQLYKFFKELQMPLQNSLCNMELIGFPANEAALRKLFQQMLETMKKLELKIYEMHGGRFNLGSTSAVAKVLGLHRKPSGRVSTSRQILEKLDSPISQAIIAYRKISTTLSKNIQPLLKCVQNNRIHGQSITYTQTGRISMTEPNLQNVAKNFVVTLEGSEDIVISCRGAFFPTESGRCLLSADFCQLEMRILAHLSQDPALLKVMNTDRDIFNAIAARWHKVSENAVSAELRDGTKQICYGIVYGMGMRSLADALKCTEQEATTLSQQFHLAYPSIRAYTEKVVKFARNNGYIETITGRRRYLEHINSCESQQKKHAERQAINSTIQGSAADIAKSAILRMEKNIEKYRDKLGITSSKAVRFVLHIHDELVFELPTEKAKKVAKILSLTMENCVKLSVPLKVKLKMGRSWGELQDIKL
ncbi:DNA polymerase theta isoform X1 [Zeugodacus cucurbitae]|uniref:DNA polymerase theta isoform X1 n=1 Tax=Zeugodacus cucurbitae TaxID=28588 RepID=UPI0023D9478C|nr:DNA polymerase theta isoform X1 [Zeugodacus cucurbitae]